ncbi:MAG: hypothetical protein MUF73_17290 [Rhodobacteraceae bacterium]|nr:hypothetical protein [Paracoccaceae bacterium]
MIASMRPTPLPDPGARARGTVSTDDGAAHLWSGMGGELPASMLSRGQIARVLTALVQDDIRRDTGRTMTRARILETDRLDEDGIGLDSLARLRAIATVTEFFGLAVTGVEDYLVIDPRLTAWTPQPRRCDLQHVR